LVAFYGKEFASRLLIGTAGYPSPAIMQDAVRASGAEIVTVSLRRESAGGRMGNAFWSLIWELGVTVLPNTAGCFDAPTAVRTAELAREISDRSAELGQQPVLRRREIYRAPMAQAAAAGDKPH